MFKQTKSTDISAPSVCLITHCFQVWDFLLSNHPGYDSAEVIPRLLFEDGMSLLCGYREI